MVATVLGSGQPSDLYAMPRGRTWTNIDTLRLDHAYMVPDRFEPLRNGRIELIGSGYYGSGDRKAYGLVWEDTAWTARWAMATDNYAIWPAVTPLDREFLVWKTTTSVDSAYHEFSYIVTADVVDTAVTPPDTVARVDAASWSYAGTSWGTRRWVATRFGQQIPMPPLRIYRSDSPHQWRQMWVGGLNAYHGVVAAALDSVTVFVVTSDSDDRIHWGLLSDTTWSVQPGYPEIHGPQTPSIVRQSDGSLRLAWANTDSVVYTRVFANGAWGPTDTVRAVLPEAAQYLFYEAQVSREGGEHPALAWSGYASRIDVADYIWVSFAAEIGFGIGERIEGSWEGINPTLVVDENEDVWVAWWRLYDGIYWTHSYATATSSVPLVDEQGKHPRLRWTLSEAAPGTWWGVMRSTDGAPPERVGRARAGPGTTLTWADSSAPGAASLRYAIRRECRDVRYQVTSAYAEWRSRGAVLALSRRSANPASDAIELEVSGANAGSLEVLLYDLQGRTVSTLRMSTTGSGVDALRVPLGPRVRTGLYFLRVRGSDGRLSRGLKVAVLR